MSEVQGWRFLWCDLDFLKGFYYLLPFSVSSVVNTLECLLWEGKIIDNGPLFQRRAGWRVWTVHERGKFIFLKAIL